MTRLTAPRIKQALEFPIIDVLAARGFTPGASNENLVEVPFRCPLPDHDDHNPSFMVNTTTNVWKCFGCDRGGDVIDLVMLLDTVTRQDAIEQLLAMRGDSEKPDAPASGRDQDARLESVPQGCTREQVGEAKGVPADFLVRCGWTTIPEYMGAPAVRIPYHDEAGEERAVRYRAALTGDGRFRWKKNARPMLYGLGHLVEARHHGYVILVEGETDTVTLWYQGFPAVGVPGAGTWKDSWATELDTVKTIYLVVEPDTGGEQLLAALSDSTLRDRLRIIHMLPETNDMNALFLADRAGFRPRVKALMDGAQSLYDLDTQMSAADLARAEALCRDLIGRKDILAPFAETIRQLGVAGEEQAVKLLYLVLTSRFLAKPVPVVMKGVSSSGKSYLVQQVLRFFPESAYYTLSAASEHALIRTKESFKHRFLVIYEAEGVGSDFLQYILRSLISEGHIKYLTLVENGKKGWESMTFEKEGPSGIILTTTRVALHPENETRMFSVPTDDSPGQTTRVFTAIAAQEDRDGDGDQELLAPWIALQTVLGAGPRKVYIPYVSFFAQGVDANAPRMRRDFTNLLTLIRAHALLHHKSRARDGQGRIVATDDDYCQVYHLVADLMREGVQASIPEAVRELVLAVKELTSGNNPEANIGRLTDKLGVDQTTVRRRVSQALQRGLLINKADKGKPYRLILGDEMPRDREILPAPVELWAWLQSGEDE